jgi:hypothetical protein
VVEAAESDGGRRWRDGLGGRAPVVLFSIVGHQLNRTKLTDRKRLNEWKNKAMLWPGRDGRK